MSARTKGSHVLSAVKVLRSNRERALELLPASLHKYLEERILPSSWYPLDEHLGLLRVVAQLWPAGSGDPWMLMGRATAQADLGGLYKLLLKPGDTEATLKGMGALWRSAHDTGDARISFDGGGRATMYLRNFGVRSKEFCRVTNGYILEAIKMSGGANGRVAHDACRGDGAEECVWNVTWS
jgi:hypothetical protein